MDSTAGEEHLHSFGPFLLIFNVNKFLICGFCNWSLCGNQVEITIIMYF